MVWHLSLVMPLFQELVSESIFRLMIQDTEKVRFAYFHNREATKVSAR